MVPKTIRTILRQEYNWACSIVSDINQHLPVLYKYAKKCAHVTEMGSRTGVSTRAFLYANPDCFVSYDYQYTTPEPHLVRGIQALIALFDSCRSNGMNCRYLGENVLEVEIAETDMLFIDTYHCYEQLQKELELHADRVRRYILFHDTTQYGEVGEGVPHMDPNHPVHRNSMDGSGGIRRAINEFLASHQEWKVDFETAENNGLMVIRRRKFCRDRATHVAPA